MYTQEQPPTVRETGESVRTHYQSTAVAVWVPLLQAMITGVFLGVVAGIIAAGTGHRPWIPGFAVWSLVQAVTWLGLLRRWMWLVIALESAFGLDLNRDGMIGQQPIKPVRIEVIQDGGRLTQIADLPIEVEKLIRLATGLLAGASFSENQWTGAGAPLSRSQFRQLRDEFLRRGWLEWTNPDARGQGLQLTYPGQAVVRHFAAMANHPPTLQSRNP